MPRLSRALLSALFVSLIRAEQNNETVQNLESDFKHSSAKLNLIEKSTENSFVQKIKKNGDFVHPFSNDEINKAFKMFGTKITNKTLENSESGVKVKKENETDIKDPNLSPMDETFSETKPSEDPTLLFMAESLNETKSLEDSTVFLVAESLNETKPSDAKRDIGPQLNESSTKAVEPTTNISSQETVTELTESILNTTPSPLEQPSGEFDLNLKEKSNFSSKEDNETDGSNLGKEKIVSSNIADRKIDDVDGFVEVIQSNIKPHSKVNKNLRSENKRRAKPKKKSSRINQKTSKVVESRETQTENAPQNNSTESMGHLKQDRRMVYGDYSRPHPDLTQAFPYKLDSPYAQYGRAYPHRTHGAIVEIIPAEERPLFEPNRHTPPVSFDHQGGHSYQHGNVPGAVHIEKQNPFGPVTFGHEQGLGYQQRVIPSHDGKSITVTKEIPVPYTVRVIKQVPYPVYVKVPVNKPYPVEVPKPYKIIHEVLQPYHVKVKVPRPYEVIKPVPKPIKVPVDHPYPVHVPKPYPVTVEKKVPVTVEKKVPYPVHVPIDRPYPVHVTVPKHVPYTVEKKVPVHVRVPVDKPYPVYVPRPYPVHVAKPVPHPVEKHVPYPVKVPVRYPVKVPVPYEVVKHVPVPHHYEHNTRHNY